MSYKIKLDVFEGPFDLLVYLIENARMNIYDIQISEITDQYVKYIEDMKSLDVNLATEFMVLAAALIEIKSKLLLPRMKPDGDGVVEEDPRTELVQKILEYKRFRAAAELLEQSEEEGHRIFEKPKEDLSPYTKEPDELLNLDISQFMKAFKMFLLKKKKLEEIRKNYTRVERQKITIESKIEFIINLFRSKEQRRLSFKELLTPGASRYDLVLTFVSMLEMIRQKSISVRQNVNFGEILINIADGDQDGSSELQEEGESVS
ncbi:MAG: chromosome segregation protein ScpA [Bacillota bacterium]|jgi:segregation and condensation protein A|nr:chromosome segregation protein ScpA [Bacillota bacterium]